MNDLEAIVICLKRTRFEEGRGFKLFRLLRKHTEAFVSAAGKLGLPT
jgi:hypothetical protein